MSRLVFVLGLIISVFLVSLVFAGIPHLINYQGMLTQSDGKTPVTNANYPILFSIYNTSSGGSSLWSHTYNVAATNGLFNVILGDSGAPINLPFDTTYWLGIKVGADPELSPRVRLTSVGYAYRAWVADSAVVAGSAGGGSWVDDGTVVRLETSTDSVGIGTDAPGTKLHVVGGGFLVSTSQIGGSGCRISGNEIAGTGVNTPGFNPLHIKPGDNSSNILLAEDGGNVGIGTNSPVDELTVAGDLRVEYPYGSTKYVEIYHNGAQPFFHTSNGPFYFYSDVNDGVWVGTGDFIVQNGNVGIGTTSPTQKLDVDGTARLRGIGSSGTGTTVIADANGVLYKFSSSRRYKEDIRGLETDPQDVLKLQPKRFKWKNTGQEDVGLIAEDVEQQIPDLVIYDNEGKPDAVKYDAVTLYLLELVKEQQKKIETLEAKLDKLESVH